MITQAKITDIITQLQHEKDQFCVSVIVPTFRISRERTQNPERIRKALNKAKKIIQAMVKSKTAALGLIQKLDDLHAGFDNLHAQNGVGFFVSSKVAIKVDFPFDVQEKIVIAESFEVRDLYYFKQFAIEYYILLLTINKAQLFKACLDKCEEVNDRHFPVLYEDDYEYATPAPASSMRGSLQTFERDKNQLKEIRQKSFFQEIESELGTYLAQDTPLLIAGVGEQVAMFKKVAEHLKNIAGEVPGNFTRDYHLLATKAWHKIRSHQVNHVQTSQIKQLKEAFGKKKVVTGIREVWSAIKEGRGLAVYVEKDFVKSAYVSTGSDQLFLRPPRVKYTRIEDVVDDTLEAAREKRTEIHFMENEKLKSFDRIALFLRY